MRILVVASRDSAHPNAAGGDLHLTQLAQGLAALGHEVTLLAASHPSLPKYERQGRLTIDRVAPARMLFVAVWERLLVNLHGRFDVVIEEAVGGERAPFFAKLLSGSPTVQFWFQDNRPLFATYYGRLGRTAGVLLQRLLLRLNRSGFALANSGATRSWLLTQGFTLPRTAVSYPKVQLTDVPPELLPFSERSDWVLTIGNFRATKRFEEAIAVLAAVRRENPKAQLMLVGREMDASYLKHLRGIVGRLGLEDAVAFRVGVGEREKFELLAHAKVLTVHSPVEGFGWTIPEAGLCGVPVVGNRGVPEEVLREGVNGERLEFGDVDAYAERVGRLLVDPALWQQYSAGAHRVALEFVDGPVEESVVDMLGRCAHEGSSRGASVQP
jgi:glycosyltransferase involved in cell wall biosynthesis